MFNVGPTWEMFRGVYSQKSDNVCLVLPKNVAFRGKLLNTVMSSDKKSGLNLLEGQK